MSVGGKPLGKVARLMIRLSRTHPTRTTGAMLAAQLTMPSGGLASEPGEAPVRMDQEQVSGEIEILAGEFTGREFQLDRVVSDDTRLNWLFRARPPNQNGFLTLNLEGECLDGRKRS